MTPDTLQFSYCMNVHPGETLPDQLRALREVVPHIKAALSPDQPFGLGLRISSRCLESLRDPAALASFREALDAAGAYAFTVNAFPYGAFHRTRVKENVYAPDWLTPERFNYTLGVCEVLAALLPEGIEGSVSTVPLTYGGWTDRAADLRPFVHPLGRMADALADLEQRTGRCIHLGLEPEPDCALQTTPETIAWFNHAFFAAPPDTAARRRRHVGVCVDTCHVAMQFEDPAATLNACAAAGIRVSKVQVSAALACSASPEALHALQAFDDGVYLHQVKSAAGASWPDLPALFASPPAPDTALRIHCHVPLHWRGAPPLDSTTATLGPAFPRALHNSGCRHVEVETYTFDVLPASVRAGGLAENLIAECRWALQQLKTEIR